MFADKNRARGAELRCELDEIEKEFSLFLISVMLLTRAAAREKIPLGCMSCSDSKYVNSWFCSIRTNYNFIITIKHEVSLIPIVVNRAISKLEKMSGLQHF